ncbi:uncharacterized protein LOC135483511 isoform X2 [Lineus longissimus]|uniref:uncharacterized protein LOC135483511 isoform X2 n=1 Tax=Lineus longissimus TaxID=88925 RepID=UPI002B4DCC19
MATSEQMETLKKEVRSVLLSQTDGKGIPQHRFIKHYRDLLMKPLNYIALGHQNLVELLETMPDVARIEYHPKTNDAYFFGVLDKTSYVGVGARKASDMKSGLSPNMKGMWAICFPKKNSGDKSREDLLDVFAEAGEVAEIGMSQNYVFIRYWSRESASNAIDIFGEEYSVLIPEEKSGSRQFNDTKNKGKPDQMHGDHSNNIPGTGNEQKLGTGNPQEDKTPVKEQNLGLLAGYYGEGTVKTPPRDNNNNKEKRHLGERDKSRNSSGSTTSSGLHNSRTLFIGNLRESGKTKEDIEKMFKKYQVEQVRVISDKGYSFAKFATREGVERCMEDRALYLPLRFEWAKEESHSKPDVRPSAVLDNVIRDADFNADRARERAQHLELVATNHLKHRTVEEGQKQEEQKCESRRDDQILKNKQGGKNLEGRPEETTSKGKKGQAEHTQKKSLHSKNYKGYKRRNNSHMNGHVQNGARSCNDMPGLDDSDEMPELEEEMPELGTDFDDGLASHSDSFSLAGSGIERGVTVYVSHFPWQTTVEMLMALFRPYQARSVSIKRHPVITQAFVKISSAISAEQAVRELNNSFFYGQPLHVDISKNEVETFAALLQEEKEAYSSRAMTVCGGMSVLSGGRNMPLPKVMQYESMMDMAATCGSPYYIEGFLRNRFDLLVTSVVDKTYFWGHVQYMVDELRLFQKVREGLQKIPFKTPVPPTFSRGMVRNEKEWHRVWIMEDLPSDFARILCVDYGREDVVKRSDICQVPEVFWKVLPMAVPFCTISGKMPVQNMVVSATLVEKKDYVLHVNLQ